MFEFIKNSVSNGIKNDGIYCCVMFDSNVTRNCRLYSCFSGALNHLFSLALNNVFELLKVKNDFSYFNRAF